MTSISNTIPAAVGPAKKRNLMANGSIDVQKATFWALNVVTIALVSLSLWLAKGLIAQMGDLEQRTKAVELWRAEVNGNRFTSSDGREVWKEIASIRQDMLKQEPPAWLKESLAEMKATMRSVDERLRAIEAQK